MSDNKIAVNPRRLEWCLSENGADLSALGAHTRISTETLKSAQRAEAALSFRQLTEIAKYFNRSRLFFLEEGDPRPDKVYPAQFRVVNGQKPNIGRKVRAFIERVERQRGIYLGLLESLELEPPVAWRRAEIGALDGVERQADACRRWLGLEAENDFESLRKAIERKGVIVIVSNGYAGDWQLPKGDSIIGFSLYYDTLPVIAVKKQGGEPRQAFTLMHELGHLLLHKRSALDDDADLESYRGAEKAANQFAGYMLVPTAFLREIDIAAFKRLEEWDDYESFFEPYKKRWCISAEALILRLVNEDGFDVDRADYEKYKALLNEHLRDGTDKAGGGNRNRSKEPLSMFGAGFVSAVFGALYAKHITLARASSYLDNLKIRYLKELERHV